MFTKTAQYYDKIYSHKNYRAETQRLVAIIGEHLRSEGSRLLDVACGTGRHIEHLKERFDVEGLDICEELLEIAPVRLHRARSELPVVGQVVEELLDEPPQFLAPSGWGDRG